MEDRATSLITVLSSEHGRMRREQRDISKRDLQKAFKHGARKRSKFQRRWKVEHDGIIYITDPSMRHEISVYPSPLPFADIDDETYKSRQLAKYVIGHRPELCATHTVLVIDNSGSMMTRDEGIKLYRDRQVAAFSMAALEFVAEQIFNTTANNSDVFSLVKFSNSAEVSFVREPVNWVLYNKLFK